MASNKGYFANIQPATNAYRNNNQFFSTAQQIQIPLDSSNLQSLCLPNPSGAGIYMNGQTSQVSSSYSMATSMSNNSISMSPLQSPVMLQTPSVTYSPSLPSSSPTSYISSYFPSNIPNVQQSMPTSIYNNNNNNNLNMMNQVNNVHNIPQQNVMPILPVQQQQTQYQYQKERNNQRLKFLANGITSLIHYGNSCDELLQWLQDERAYNKYNEKELMNCLSSLYTYAPRYGPWSGLKIYSIVHQHLNLLSPESAKQVKIWYSNSLRNQQIPVPIQRAAITFGTSTDGSIPAVSSNTTNATTSLKNTLVRNNDPAFLASQHFVNKQISDILQSINVMSSAPTSTTTPTYIAPDNTNPFAINNNNQQNIAPETSFQYNNTQTTQATTVTQTSNTSSSFIDKTSTPQDLSSLYKIKYMFKFRFILQPYRLRHNQQITDTKIFIGDAEYKQLKAPLDSRSNPPNFYPLKYIFTAWKKGTPDTKCEWSEYITVLINNKEANLERRKKITGPDGVTSIYLGKDRPFDLLPHLKPGNNILTIIQKGCACDYSFSVSSYICQSEDSIEKNLMDKVFSITDGEKCVNKLLSIDRNSQHNDDDDDEIHIVQQSVKLNLKCPISFTLIKKPVKGEDCKHPDCFDFNSYLAVNQDLATWKCPHCNGFLPPNKLKRDLYFERLLQTVPKYASEIIMTRECPEWKVTNSDFPDDDLDDSDDEENHDKKKLVVKANTNNNNNSDNDNDNNNNDNHQVINLISDEEDENEEDEENQNNKKRRRIESTYSQSTATTVENNSPGSAPSMLESSNTNVSVDTTITSTATTIHSPNDISSSSNNMTNDNGLLLAPDLLNIFEKIFNGSS